LWTAASRQPVTAEHLREWDAVGGPSTISNLRDMAVLGLRQREVE